MPEATEQMMRVIDDLSSSQEESLKMLNFCGDLHRLISDEGREMEQVVLKAIGHELLYLRSCVDRGVIQLHNEYSLPMQRRQLSTATTFQSAIDAYVSTRKRLARKIEATDIPKGKKERLIFTFLDEAKVALGRKS